MKSICIPLLFTFFASQITSATEIGKVNIYKLSSDFHGPTKASPLRFSWKLKQEGRAQLQGSYRILVSDSPEKLKAEEKLIWDSGEIQSGQSLYVPYEGPSLISGQKYFWKAQLKNNDEQSGDWSSIAQFTLPKGLTAPRSHSQSKAPTASFLSSNQNLNSLFTKALTVQNNVLSSPAAFEPNSLPWGAPLQLTARGFAFQTDLSDYYRRTVEELYADLRKDKLIPSLVGQPNDTAPSPGFSEAGIVIPFVLWQLTGDLTFAEPHFLSAVDHVIAMQKNDLEYKGISFGKHLGDWGHKDDPTSAGFLSLTHFALNCRILAEMAEALKHLPYIVQHKEWYDRVKKSFLENHLEDGKLKEKSQTAMILALRLGLLPQKSKQPIADALAARIKDEGLTAGMFGQAVVLPVLSWTNHHDQAVELAQSYGTAAAEPSVVSLAASAEWMMSFLAGFIHQAPGFKTSRISPFIPEDGSVTEVKALHETPYGRLAIHWKTVEDGLTAKVTIPPNTVAVISLPALKDAVVTENNKTLEDAIGCQLIQELNGRQEIIAQSGVYSFEVRNPKQ